MKTPHKHAEVIKAWADGATIQSRRHFDGEWQDIHGNEPKWIFQFEYRVKPNTLARYIATMPDVYGTICVSGAHAELISIQEVWGDKVSTVVKLEFCADTGAFISCTEGAK